MKNNVRAYTCISYIALGLFIGATFLCLPGCKSSAKKHPAKKLSCQKKSYLIGVSGVECPACESDVIQALNRLSIKHINVINRDYAQMLITLSITNTTIPAYQAIEAIEVMGFECSSTQ